MKCSLFRREEPVDSTLSKIWCKRYPAPESGTIIILFCFSCSRFTGILTL
jgi:hypothetical protein